jgi:single-stranded DNA-binding protein
MSSGFNQALLLGRLVAPPEELKTKNGKLFLKAVVAVTVHQKTSEGASEERTSFIPVTIFGRQAEIFQKYVAKRRHGVPDRAARFKRVENGFARAAIVTLIHHRATALAAK